MKKITDFIDYLEELKSKNAFITVPQKNGIPWVFDLDFTDEIKEYNELIDFLKSLLKVSVKVDKNGKTTYHLQKTELTEEQVKKLDSIFAYEKEILK